MRSTHIFLITLFSCLLHQGCEENEPEKVIDDDGISHAVVLRSAGSNYPDFWDHLNTSWADYGSREISIDHLTMDHEDITFEEISALAPDVLIIADARNSMVDETFLPDEVNVIIQYVTAGRGLIVTGGTLRPEHHWALAHYLGYFSTVAGQVYYGVDSDSIITLDSSHQLFENIDHYKTGSNSVYSGYDWNRDGIPGDLEDWTMRRKSPDTEIIAMILGKCEDRPDIFSPISFLKADNYTAVFAGHNPASAEPSRDDYQFYYNMIVSCDRTFSLSRN